jgi:hypothetical protein
MHTVTGIALDADNLFFNHGDDRVVHDLLTTGTARLGDVAGRQFFDHQMLLPVLFVKTKGRQNCRPLQLDCVCGACQKIVLLSGIATKRVSYKDNASEKGKSITEDGGTGYLRADFNGRRERNCSRARLITRKKVKFNILI